MKTPARASLLSIWLIAVSTAHGADASATDVLKTAGAKGGLIVHVGCGDGTLTAALRAGDRYLVQGLDTDADDVRRARAYVDGKGLTGPVTVDRFDGRRLPYTANLVNVLVISERYDLTRDEMLRVLAPGGAMCVRQGDRWQKSVKPWPDRIDRWTHYLHDPSNNAVADDALVGPPRHMQWLAEPLWTRNHHRLCSISSVVTDAGRLFYIVDEATAANMSVPGKWSIVARDAFSGVQLWDKQIETWVRHGWRFRSGPPQVTRLLVAKGEHVYVPLALSAPVSQLDAATGKTLQTYEQTAGAEEILLVGGVLLVLKGDPVAEQAVGHKAFKGRYKFPNKKHIVAVKADTGKKLWQWTASGANPMPETLASDGKRVVFQAGSGVVCLDVASGKRLWVHGKPSPIKRKPLTFGVYTLVVADGVVLCKLGGKLVALSAEDGKTLWACDAGGGFHAPLDVFVIDGKVWLGDHTEDSVSPPPVTDFNLARDVHTGEVLSRNAVMVDLQTTGHHHRCYREKATSRYILAGKRGIEMMDLVGDAHSRNNWVRGACQYGILPANGLIYVPPHACGCYMESKLYGFWALAADRPTVTDAVRTDTDDRLEKGPAYGKLDAAKPAAAEDWPFYRHDALRSGVASTSVPTDLKQTWKTQLGGALTQPVIAAGQVFVASKDRHTVIALDGQSGKVLWRHVAGGRIDSPPAAYKGWLLFGSADGHVTCLRQNDGQLAWRFRAAPANLRTVALGQVESLWPVHGSVLVLNGVAYCSAGRSTWLDGGIDLYGLDPATGKVLFRTDFESQHPTYQQNKDQAKPEHETRIAQNTTDYKTFLAPDRSDAFSMAAGAISDVLVSDGTNVYLHHVQFDRQLNKQDELSRHLFATSSLLDPTENHRSHWVLGTGDFSRIPVAYSWIANRKWTRGAVLVVPAGVLLVFDDQAVWGFRRKGDATGKYQLYEKSNKPFQPDEPSLPDFRKIPKKEFDRCVWKTDCPVRARAMLKSGDRLFLGAMPVEVPVGDPYAAYEGRKGGMIWIASAKDGARLADVDLDSPVVWDGMAAARGRLFVATEDGAIRCFASPKSKALASSRPPR